MTDPSSNPFPPGAGSLDPGASAIEVLHDFHDEVNDGGVVRAMRARMWRTACVTALAGLPKMGPARLRALLIDGSPESAWEALGDDRPVSKEVRRACGPDHSDMIVAWRRLVRRTDPLQVYERYRRSNIDVWSIFDEYPSALIDDVDAPTVLFHRGDVSALSCRRVAIIGTRQCTNAGRSIARRFGAELAEAGVAVVSGLALGIDGAAHRGAIDAGGAPPIGVVGSGLDQPYPRRNADLWQRMGDEGLILAESPLGALPEPWRFPARNRIIAGLSELVVVVESHETGGSLLTVEQALNRGIDVMAVPGSVQSPASRGSNALIGEGMPPACSTEDILLALSLQVEGRREPTSPPSPDDGDLAVFTAIDWEPVSTDEILERTGLTLGEVASSLDRLEHGGWIEGGGGWWRRVEFGLDQEAG